LISDGLAVGERLVLEGTDKLKQGSAVQVIAKPGDKAQASKPLRAKKDA
jgi:membrane fusion protein, multidrug efflux system